MNNIDNVTQKPEDGTQKVTGGEDTGADFNPEIPATEGGETSPDETSQDQTETSEENQKGTKQENQEGQSANEEKDLQATLDEREKALKGFQKDQNERILKERKLAKENEELKKQLAAATSGDEDSPMAGALKAKLVSKDKELAEARATAATAEILRTSKLPETIKARIAANPLAFIKVDDLDPETIAYEVGAKLPPYLEELENEVTVGAGSQQAAKTTAETGSTSTPVPGNISPTRSNVIYADELPDASKDPKKWDEIDRKISTGELKLLPTRKLRQTVEF